MLPFHAQRAEQYIATGEVVNKNHGKILQKAWHEQEDSLYSSNE
jgi:hypothetical protein